MPTRTRIALLCAALALAVSLPALRNDFAIDDLYVFVEQPVAHSLRNIPRFFSGSWGGGTTDVKERVLGARYYRPLPTTLGAVEYAVFGLRPAGFHLTSALLHAATSALVALLLWQLTGGAVTAVLLGGLVFAVHPAQSEAFCAACYQTTLLAGFFGTLTLLVFGRVLERGASWPRLVGLGATLLCALLSKEEAFAIPFLATAWAMLVRPPGWQRALGLGLLPMAVVVSVAFALRHAFVSISPVTYFGTEPARVVAWTMVRVAALYFELLLLPLRFCPFYDWFIIGYERGPSLMALTGAAVLLVAVVAFVLYARRAPRIALGIAWMLLALLPVSQIAPIIVVAAERFLYIPMLGFSLLAGLALHRAIAWAGARGWRRPAVAAAALLLSMAAARTVARVPDWRNDETINRATARAFPETPTPLLNLASYYTRMGEPDKALGALDEAERRIPGWRPALAFRARLLQRASR